MPNHRNVVAELVSDIAEILSWDHISDEAFDLLVELTESRAWSI